MSATDLMVYKNTSKKARLDAALKSNINTAYIDENGQSHSCLKILSMSEMAD